MSVSWNNSIDIGVRSYRRQYTGGRGIQIWAWCVWMLPGRRGCLEMTSKSPNTCLAARNYAVINNAPFHHAHKPLFTFTEPPSSFIHFHPPQPGHSEIDNTLPAHHFWCLSDESQLFFDHSYETNKQPWIFNLWNGSQLAIINVAIEGIQDEIVKIPGDFWYANSRINCTVQLIKDQYLVNMVAKGIV